jgi:hypothetical protein
MKTILAYRKYPLPQGTIYFRDDLKSVEQIEQLFDYCQIWEAIIYKEGWDYLVDDFGYSKLFEINNNSGWKDCDTLEEFIQDINDQRNQSLSHEL